MNWVDLLLAIVVLLGAWAGARRGFLRSSLFLATVVASLLIAFLTYRYPAEWLQPAVPQYAVWLAPGFFMLIFILVQLLLDTFAQKLLTALPRRVEGNRVNLALGVVPGFVHGLFNAAVIAIVLTSAPLPEVVSEPVRESALTARLSEPAQWVESRLAPIFDPAIQKTLRALTVPVDSSRTVQLPFKVVNPRARPDLETRMLEMVNAERAKQGLKPVKADPEVAEVARAHSRDMFARGYFSHVTPEGRSLADRMRKAEVRFVVAGENLALAATLNGAHQGLMNSPGHRANILRPQFGRLGIGVLDGGAHGLMVTQNFRN